jgi:outer membrane lipoprotein-sorting protein
MKKYLCIAIFVAIYSNSFSIPHATHAHASLNNKQETIKYVTDNIKKLDYYQVHLITKIYPPTAGSIKKNKPDDFNPDRFLEVNTIVFGESGKKMRLFTIMKSPDPKFEMEMEITHIFDGTWMWAQNKTTKHPKLKANQPMIAAFKIHIPSVSPDPINEPFNIIYGITGTGLYRYKDLPGTFTELLKEYNFKNITHTGDSNELVFTGTSKVSSIGTAKGDAREQLETLMAKNTRICKLWVSKDTGLIKAYSMGQSEDRPTTRTEIEYISVNQKLPEGTFKYLPPKGVEVKDITETILKQKEQRK